MKIIYESKKLRFAIGKDTYQWIICKRAGCQWKSESFHPNLCNLLDELAEVYFKKFTKRLKTLKDLEKSITKVYRLNKRIYNRLKNSVQ